MGTSDIAIQLFQHFIRSLAGNDAQTSQAMELILVQLWNVADLCLSHQLTLAYARNLADLPKSDTIQRTDICVCRLFSLQVHERVLNSRWIPTVLQAARSAIFPDNVLAPARTPPTDHETVQIKRECAVAIVDSIPAGMRTSFFATRDIDQMRSDVESELDLLSHTYLNKHLVVRVVELLVARLFPELASCRDEELAVSKKWT